MQCDDTDGSNRAGTCREPTALYKPCDCQTTSAGSPRLSPWGMSMPTCFCKPKRVCVHMAIRFKSPSKCTDVGCWHTNTVLGHNLARRAEDRPDSPKTGLQLNVYISPKWDPISLNFAFVCCVSAFDSHE